MSYTDHLLSSSSSLKKKRVLIYLAWGKLKEVGQVFGNPLWKLLSPLNMTLVCVSSFSWVIRLSMSHTNSMCHHTYFSSQRVLLLPSHYILVIRRVNVVKSVVVPHHVQGKFHFKPSICSITSFHFMY